MVEPMLRHMPVNTLVLALVLSQVMPITVNLEVKGKKKKFKFLVSFIKK